MKRALITARKAAAERVVQALRRGRKPFYGARAKGSRPKDFKDLRGPKGMLLKEAEELALAEEETATGTRRALSRPSSTAARR